MKNSPMGLCFICNKSGFVTKILRNDTLRFKNTNLPLTIESFFDNTFESNLDSFWNTLLNNTTISDWIITVCDLNIVENYKFSGIVAGDEVYISAFKIDEVLRKLEFESKILNRTESLNLNKEPDKLLSEFVKFENIDALSELSQLNNEMANTQKALIKKNAEITKLNYQLKKANQELEQLTYVASHDLKEPLRMVTSFMNLLKKNYYHQLDEKAHTYINFAIDGGSRMQTMINDLLDLSRTTRPDEEKSQVNLTEITEQVLVNLHSLIEENEAEIIIESALPEVMAYKHDFTRIFQNLIANAIKFRRTEIKPVVRINTSENTTEWIFSIADNGIGIDPENFDKVFNIFTRINPIDDFEGSGIGLAICKKVVEKYGGKIWIESDRTSGCIFYFSIKK